MPINQITSNNTFQQWLTATQALIQFANTITDGNGATFTSNTIFKISGTGSKLFVDTSANINQLYANTINVVNSNSNISNSTISNIINLNVTNVAASNIVSSNISVTTINVSGQIIDKSVLDDYDDNIIHTQAAYDRANNSYIVPIYLQFPDGTKQYSANIGNLNSVLVEANSSIGINTNPLGTYNFEVRGSSFANNVYGETYYIGPTTYWTVSGDGVYHAFDSNDYASYDKVNNTYSIFIGGTNRLLLRSDGSLELNKFSIENDGTLLSQANTHLKVPIGTTAERSGTPEVGGIRYNTSVGSFEGYGSLGWTNIGGGFSNVVSISVDTTAETGKLYAYTSNVAITLPSTPTVGNFVGISNQSGYTSSNVARNGSKIMGLDENMTIDALYAGFTLYYSGVTKGWIIL
jgi:hypothetical protein